jgi:hypothetical protein
LHETEVIARDRLPEASLTYRTAYRIDEQVSPLINTATTSPVINAATTRLVAGSAGRAPIPHIFLSLSAHPTLMSHHMLPHLLMTSVLLSEEEENFLSARSKLS